jgi:hypothetical protein
MIHFFPKKLAQLLIKKAHGAKIGGLSHLGGDDYICGIHDPDVSMSCFRAPCQQTARSTFYGGDQKLPMNVFYLIKASPT